LYEKLLQLRHFPKQFHEIGDSEMKEQLSALVDGELDMDGSPHLYTALRKSGEAVECWSTYHLIGDVMRGDLRLQAGLQARIMQRLEAEPVVLAPRRRLHEMLHSGYAMPMAASAAAVAFVGWMVWQAQGVDVQPNLARTSIAQNTISPEALNSYMLAHQEYAPINGMQRAYDVKQVTYSEPGN
jgi:sigma-E factor negative regulatory protein RseA